MNDDRRIPVWLPLDGFTADEKQALLEALGTEDGQKIFQEEIDNALIEELRALAKENGLSQSN